MYIPKIKLIDENTDINSLKMMKMDWDVILYNKEYQVVSIEGYIHSIGGRQGNNDLWMYPRNEEPSYENLVEYNCEGCGVCWGFTYSPHNYLKCKWEENECFTSGGVMITRNGEDFCFCRGGIDEARCLLNRIDEHPLDLNTYGFAEKMIGRKVWWRSEPAIITRWIGNGQACVILEPDGIESFKIPEEYKDDTIFDDIDKNIKTDIFDKHIYWFRRQV